MYTPEKLSMLADQQMDPYLVWAVATEFAGFPLTDKGEVPLLLEGQKKPDAWATLIERLREADVHVPPHNYKRPSRYITAYAPGAGGSLYQAIQIATESKIRWELGLPLASPDGVHG